MGDEKSSAEIAKDVEKLVKTPVSNTLEKVEVQKPKYDDKPIIPYLQKLRKNILDKQFGRSWISLKSFTSTTHLLKHLSKCRDT